MLLKCSNFLPIIPININWPWASPKLVTILISPIFNLLTKLVRNLTVTTSQVYNQSSFKDAAFVHKKTPCVCSYSAQNLQCEFRSAQSSNIRCQEMLISCSFFKLIATYVMFCEQTNKILSLLPTVSACFPIYCIFELCSIKRNILVYLFLPRAFRNGFTEISIFREFCRGCAWFIL